MQEAPQGGPVDSDPPKLIASYPEPFTVHYSEQRIVLEFSEYVDQRSVEESIFISPYVGELEFDWSGREVEIAFPEQLRKNTTYVVNVGTDVQDLHSNKMADAATLAFSTGDDIDHGSIEGKVFRQSADDELRGVMIFAYSLDGINPDTLDPQKTKPDYITQTGKDGSFFLRHLSFGSYRVLAVRDAYRNLVYDPEADQFGAPAEIAVLTPADTLKSGLFMRLAVEDTTAPRLVKAECSDSHHMVMEFSEEMDTSANATLKCAVVDTMAQQPLEVHSLFPNLPGLKTFTVVTATQDSSAGYRISAAEGYDLAGNRINPNANSLVASGSPQKTRPPRLIALSVADSARSISLKPEFTVLFSDAMARESIRALVLLGDKAGSILETGLRWLNDAAVVVAPRARLGSKSWFTLIVRMREAKDWRDSLSTDTTRTVRFETLDDESMSSIEGTTLDHNRSDTSGTVYVMATSVLEKAVRSYTVTSAQDGRFAFSEILEGKYVLQAFRDRNRNQIHDVGRPYPFSPSERLSSLSDTLKVRARWPLEGVKIELP